MRTIVIIISNIIAIMAITIRTFAAFIYDDDNVDDDMIMTDYILIPMIAMNHGLE